MDAEKRVVELWLNRQGFFTIKDINAGKNVIDIIGIKLKNSQLDRIVQVEVACSVSSELPITDYIKKFKDKEVIKKIRGIVSSFVGQDKEYEKILITTSRVNTKAVNDIQVIKFSNILTDVLAKLDKQNYQNAVVRTLQLVKFILLKRKKLVRKLSKREQLSQFGSFLPKREAYSIIMKSNLPEKITKNYLKKNKDWLVEFLRKIRKDEREKIIKGINRRKKKQKLVKVKPLRSFFK